MSGGNWEYRHHVMNQIADDIELLIENNGKEIPKEDRDEWSGTHYPEYNVEVIQRFKKAVIALKRAYVYAHEVDYLLSGDTGEESFLKRIKEKLK